VKPICQSRGSDRRLEFCRRARPFPLTDYCFHSSDWHGHSLPYDGQDRFRSFRNLTREFFGEEARREHVKEMIVFALVAATSAWPVIYMIVTVVRLLWKGRAGL